MAMKVRWTMTPMEQKMPSDISHAALKYRFRFMLPDKLMACERETGRVRRTRESGARVSSREKEEQRIEEQGRPSTVREWEKDELSDEEDERQERKNRQSLGEETDGVRSSEREAG